MCLSKVHFSVGMGIYMISSDLNLNIGKTKGHNNITLVSSTDIKIGSNRGINKDHKILPSPVPDQTGGVAHERVIMEKGTNEPVKDCLVTQDENLKMFAEKHNNDKLAKTFLIVGAGLNAYHFSVDNK